MQTQTADPVTRATTQEYPDHYTSEDRMAVRTITAMMASTRLSSSSLATLSGCSVTTVSHVLNGKLPRSPSDWLKRFKEEIDRYMGHDLEFEGLDEAPDAEPIAGDHVETSVYRAVAAACYRARRYAGIGVVSAFVGTGKTTALRHIAQTQPNVYLIEGLPSMTHSVLLDELIDAVGCPVKAASTKTGGTKAEKTRALIGALKGKNALILLDEADKCSGSTLEYVRRIRDLAQAGVVLCGTERLMPMIRDPRGRFGQISSRVNYWPPVIKRCSNDDIRALTEAYLPDIELSDELLTAFEMACDGSARVLCEGVLPGVVDYGLRKGHELTPALVKKISRDLLGFTPAKAKA
jgi:DNA transposition AAA+ family ATPase